MEDINSTIDENMKFYTADAIRKMMAYESYTAEDFVRKIIMPKIVSAALQNEYHYDFNLIKYSLLKNSKHHLKDIIEILTDLGFYVSQYEYDHGIYRPNELHISWDKKKESDKNEV